MTRSLSQVRGDFATRIDAIEGWTLAKVPADAFGVNDVGKAVPSTRAHLAFAVGLEECAPDVSARRDRQRASEGLLVSTGVLVRFLSRVAAKNQVGSVDDGLDAEVTLIAELLERGASWPANFHVWFTSARRSTAPGSDYRVHEVRFGVLHRIDITTS